MKYVLLLLVFFFFLSVNAQKKKENIHYTNFSLDNFLNELELLFDIKFSYNTTSFKELSISIEKDAVSLKEIITILSDRYAIHFKQIDDRYYVVNFDDKISICGYLIDDKSNIIEGASIINKIKKTGTLSDENGSFVLIENSISDTITISYLGYKTISFPIKNLVKKKCDTYTLNPEGFVLNELVIKEYLTSGIVKNRDGSIKIRPNDQSIISGLSEPDILQSIQLLPGIESPQETASGIYIRGGTPDQNLILWDGIKMYNSDHFFGLISAFNPYITEDITIYKNGTQPIYGDRVSGVIDIKTDQKVPKEISGGIGVNMTHADAYLKLPLSEKTAIFLSTRRSITDVIETPTINTYSERSFQNTSITENLSNFDPRFIESKELFYFTDATLKLITNLSEKDNISISNLFTRNKLNYSFKDVDFADISSDELAIKNFGTNIKWNRKWNSRFSSEMQLSFSEYDLKYNGRYLFTNQDLTVVKKNTIKEHGLLFHSNWDIVPHITFSNGYQLYTNNVSYYIENNDDIFLDTQGYPTHSLYSQLEYSTPKTWLINFGARGTYYSGLQSVFIEPRLYIERKLGNYFRVNGSVEIKNQSISQIIEFSTFSFGLENQVWLLAKEQEIPLLRSHQYTAGGLFHSKNLDIETDTYYRKTIGLTSITRGFESSDSNLFYEGESISKGIDLLIKKKIRKYSTAFGYSFSDTEFMFDTLNQSKTFKGNNNITHSISWSHAYQWKKIQFSLGWKYHTGIPFTTATGFSIEEDEIIIDYESTNTMKLPDYHRLDFSVVYDFNWSAKNDRVKSRIGFSLLNIYKRKNILNRSYAVYEITNIDNSISYELREINRYSLGVTPNISFRVSF
ncbi:TonB-dependent receptor [Aquimarina longa]|uniref:TonB-dependent receptor n=1 Tax=Aquimarina longa TaxID=1080221 RepID=UPI0007824B12|nr:carboxypeptidase-like regulatory domain-containing protein [Aquimarina longa]